MFERGGYDNHDGTAANPNTQRCRAGFRIGQMIHYAALRGSPLFVIVTTDGGMSIRRVNGVAQTDPSGQGGSLANPLAGNFNFGGRGMIRWPGDNDNLAIQFALAYIPGKTRGEINAQENRQVGAYSRFGVVNNLITSNDPNNVAKLMAYNWLALHGRETEFRTLVEGGRAGGVASNEPAFLKFKKVIG